MAHTAISTATASISVRPKPSEALVALVELVGHVSAMLDGVAVEAPSGRAVLRHRCVIICVVGCSLMDKAA